MIIATRKLILRTATGNVEVPIDIHAPERDETMRCWKCRYAVGWPDGVFESEGYGQDAVQAIELTFQKIGIELYVSDAHKEGRLGWDEVGNGYGFLVSRNVRGLLVGYDKRFYGEGDDE